MAKALRITAVASDRDAHASVTVCDAEETSTVTVDGMTWNARTRAVEMLYEALAAIFGPRP